MKTEPPKPKHSLFNAIARIEKLEKTLQIYNVILWIEGVMIAIYSIDRIRELIPY